MTSFRDFEHERWQEAVETYAGFWAGLTRQTIRPLLDALEVSPETHLLDVSCGTGHVAAAAASKGASVVGIDFSSAMLTRARRLHPTLDFRLGDAEELEFPDESFDAVAINFGMLHFQHPERALAQAHRVLHPGGRAAYTVWSPPDQSRAFEVVYGSIHDYGTLEVPLPPGPPFFRFSDPEESRRILLETGFREPRIESLRLTWRVPSAAALLRAFEEGTARTGPTLLAQRPEDLVRIRNAILERATAYEGDGGLEVPMVAVLCRGRKESGPCFADDS